ncbi:TIGR04282 family arsenosugar biosynthesis glycosyltransferase [Hyphomonas sp.]|uniref:TIGR04282 family arsenosugar biosynthesis glycosyltransferase n=1 Tax=Hyphomonas sp. TaxID=87 RepID=UPI00391BD6A0
MRPATLLIFAKPPRIGLSKTRLAADLGKAAARRIALFTLGRTLRAAQASGCNVRVYVAPDAVARRPGEAGLFRGAALFPQGGGDLTDRLTRALREAPCGPVLFAGADVPDITPARIRQAAALLRQKDAVFGPARDGGFWLFGLHKRTGTPAPFAGVRWSGPHAMEDVWSQLPSSARIGLLETLIDIDEAQDWEDWNQSRA